MPVIENTRRDKFWVGYFDFAVDGGAIGAIPLRSNDGAIPALADVLEGYLDIETALTSGGAATISGGVESAVDLFAVTAVATFSLGRKNVLPQPASGSVTAYNAIRTTVARVPALTVAAFALTAGKLRLILKWR